MKTNTVQKTGRSEREIEIARRRIMAKRKRRKKIRRTLILFFVLLLCIAGGLGVLYYMNHQEDHAIVRKFNVLDEFKTEVASVSNERMIGVAANLCVTDVDVPMEGISLEENQAACLMGLAQHRVLFSQNLYKKIYPASITKIMTGLLAIQLGNMDDTITITSDDLNLEEGSQVCGLEVGDTVKMSELLHGLLVFSGNDAAMAVANHIGGNTQNFVQMMNDKAAELGMTGTHFMNPSGLHDPKHFTTVYDIYLLLQEAYKYPAFTNITQLPNYTMELVRADGTAGKVQLESTDYYLNGQTAPPNNVTILGGKTGTTDEAGNCLALLSQNAYGNPYISIVLNAEEKPILYEQMDSLLNRINS